MINTCILLKPYVIGIFISVLSLRLSLPYIYRVSNGCVYFAYRYSYMEYLGHFKALIVKLLSTGKIKLTNQIDLIFSTLAIRFKFQVKKSIRLGCYDWGIFNHN